VVVHSYIEARPYYVTLALNIVDTCIAKMNTNTGTLHTLQTRIKSGGGKCLRLNGVLVRLDHPVSFRLDDKQEVTILVVTNQLANLGGLPKSETVIVLNVGGYGTTQCVTLEALLHIVYSAFRSKSGDMAWRQLKKNIPIIRRR
jgi:hypothetical protein